MTTQQMLTGLNCICETTELKIQDCTMEEFAEATHCVVADPSLMRISASGLSHTNMKVGLFSLFIWRLRALRLRGHTQATFAQVCFSNWNSVPVVPIAWVNACLDTKSVVPYEK